MEKSNSLIRGLDLNSIVSPEMLQQDMLRWKHINEIDQENLRLSILNNFEERYKDMH